MEVKGCFKTEIDVQPGALASIMTMLPGMLKVLTLWHHKQRRGAVKRQRYKLTLTWELAQPSTSHNGEVN